MDQKAAAAAVSGAENSVGIALAFEEFFEAERARLFRALLLVTHDSAESEDLMQEAFVRVWERWDRVAQVADHVGHEQWAAFSLRVDRVGERRREAMLREHHGEIALHVAPFEEPEADLLEHCVGAQFVADRQEWMLT